MSQLCALIATQLDLVPAMVAQLRVAGLLHDVGKIGIPDSVLTKPAGLTDGEYEHMKRHSILGEQIVAAAGHAQRVALGPPSPTSATTAAATQTGWRAENIPLQSRIILAADTFEAMTSDRPYRLAPGRASAVAELRRHMGTQFDPVVVRALCEAL